MPKRSMRPSSIMARPPVSPSSLGWNTTTTVPSKLRVSHRYLAAPSSMAVCPSWPHACILPGVFEAYGHAGHLLDRQGVHVGAQRHHPAGRRLAPVDDADDAGLADARNDVVAAEGFELLRHDTGGAVHVEPELRVRMQVAAPRGDLLVHGGDAVHDWHPVYPCSSRRQGSHPSRKPAKRKCETMQCDACAGAGMGTDRRKSRHI